MNDHVWHSSVMDDSDPQIPDLEASTEECLNPNQSHARMPTAKINTEVIFEPPALHNLLRIVSTISYDLISIVLFFVISTMVPYLCR